MMFCSRAFAISILAVVTGAVQVHDLGFQQKKKLIQPASPLPPVFQVPAQPKHVLSKMNSNIELLTRNLAQIRNEHNVAVAVERKKYEDKLLAQKLESTNVARRIEKLQASIQVLQAENLHTREHADSMRQASQKLLRDAHDMQANFTSASEVLVSVLQDVQANTTASPELAVLDELAKEEATNDAEADRVRRLDAIARPRRLTLLQTASVTSPGGSHEDAQKIVQSLLSSLGSLGEEQNASSTALKAEFEKEYEARSEKLKELNAVCEKLNASEADEKDTLQRLQAADQYVTKLHEELQAKALSVRGFAKNIGDRPMPLGENSTAPTMLEQGAKVVAPKVMALPKQPQSHAMSSEARYKKTQKPGKQQRGKSAPRGKMAQGKQ